MSAFGTLSGTLFTGSRVFYAGAKDGLMPFSKIFSLVSESFETPHTAIILSSIVACVILMLGDFSSLINYFGFTVWLFYGLCAIALIYVRQKKKHIVLPFKVRPYPVIPIVFISATLAVVVSAFLQSPVFTLIAFLLIIFAVPFYFIFCWKDGRLFLSSKQRILNSFKSCNRATNSNPDEDEAPFEYPLEDFPTEKHENASPTM